MLIDVYLDNTPWDNNGKDDNMCTVDIPEDIVKKWYANRKEECDYETMSFTKYSEDECDFEKWIKEGYTLDGTDGLYNFAVINGCYPVLVSYWNGGCYENC